MTKIEIIHKFWDLTRGQETYPAITTYRQTTANKLAAIRHTSNAQEKLQAIRKTPEYIISRAMHQSSDRLRTRVSGEITQKLIKPKKKELRHFSFYYSNEWYKNVSGELKGIGGVGLAVGSDQGLDFFIMGNLDEMHCIDIDPHTHIVTRSYLELGARFHKLVGRYPTTGEYIALTDKNQLDITFGVLGARSCGYHFTKEDIVWLAENRKNARTAEYLRNKRRHYKDLSWIGTDANLARVIAAYEQGNITVRQGSIVGGAIRDLSWDLKKRRKEVTFVYTSNAPIKIASSIFRFQELPLADRAVLLFSAGCGYKFTDSKPPRGFALGSWTFYFLPLRTTRQWPDVDNITSYRKIANGVYRYEGT